MPLSFLVFGAGAIGTYVGGSLALSGERVVFLERPQAVAELRRRGLRLKVDGTVRTIPPPTIVGSLDEALANGPFDAAILAVKSYDTAAVVETVQHLAADMPPVLSLQNGVENEGTLAQALGAEKVIAGTVTTAIGRSETGDVFVERLRGVGIAGPHPRASELVAAFNRANLQAQWFEDAQAMKWSKMLTNLLANATSAILDLTPAQIFDHPGLYRLEAAQIREALAVMKAHHCSVVNLPGTPVRLLAAIISRLPDSLSRPLIARAVGGGRGGKMPSFHIDLHLGRKQSEVAYLNGAVVRFAERAGLSAPTNRLLTEVLMGLACGDRPIEEFRHQPDRLIALWKEYQEKE